MKSLGRWYDASHSDKSQVEELRQETRQGIAKIDKSGLKLWCLQFGLLPCLMWPLTVYEVPLSRVERMEKMINSMSESQKMAWRPTLPKQRSLVWEGHCRVANI